MGGARCLGIDLDGTLLRDDQTIAPADVQAIQRARAAGVFVTVVTSRLSSGVLSIARQVGVNAPVVCADGAVLVKPTDGEVIARKNVHGRIARATQAIFLEHGLHTFVLTHDIVHAMRSSEALAPWVRVYSPEVRIHEVGDPRLPRANDVVALLGLGREEVVRTAHAALERESEGGAELTTFPLGSGDVWAVRVQPRRCNKGAGLAALAARIGARRPAVAYVGDWYNDISAFEWAGQSFCMPHAPAEVRKHATTVLNASSDRGGAVAEVIERWL